MRKKENNNIGGNKNSYNKFLKKLCWNKESRKRKISQEVFYEQGDWETIIFRKGTSAKNKLNLDIPQWAPVFKNYINTILTPF